MPYVTCPKCRGSKRFKVKNMTTMRYELVDCRKCRGYGQIWKK